MKKSLERKIIEILVDYAYRELDAYEVSLYLYFLRKTVLLGNHQIRLGKRTLQSEFVHGHRGGGKNSKGGLWVNYKHVTTILNGLKAKGYLEIRDTTRDGTLYIINEPDCIPFIVKALSEKDIEFEQEDYFNDPIKRLEIFERDNWQCHYCGDVVNKNNVTLDHYVPQSKGGEHNKANLLTCCLPCNSIKSGRTFEEAAPQLLKASAKRRAIYSQPSTIDSS